VLGGKGKIHPELHLKKGYADKSKGVIRGGRKERSWKYMRRGEQKEEKTCSPPLKRSLEATIAQANALIGQNA